MNKVLLVDKNNNSLGKADKLFAHQKGLLHRAFSVFIFNHKGEMLLQKRAQNKYHSAGLWSNACCSHPLSDNVLLEAQKRLSEEMGIQCPLKEIFRFTYKARVGDLTENEFDYVLVGIFNGRVSPNKNEVQEYKWISFQDLKKDIAQNPQNYTQWFKLIYEKVFNTVFPFQTKTL